MSNTIADRIANTLTDNLDSIATCTLEGGYAIRRNGSRILFTPGTAIECKRNASGRCTKLKVRYEDDSVIEFRYNENKWPEYSYQAVKS